jgi:hypothetical protein
VISIPESNQFLTTEAQRHREKIVATAWIPQLWVLHASVVE